MSLEWNGDIHLWVILMNCHSEVLHKQAYTLNTHTPKNDLVDGWYIILQVYGKIFICLSA